MLNKKMNITNKSNNKCITQDSYDNDWGKWDGYKMIDCDTNNKNQLINLISGKETKYSNSGNPVDTEFIKFITNSAEMFISRQNLDISSKEPIDIRHAFVGGDNNSNGKSNRFMIDGVGKNSDKKGIDAVNNGAFEFGSSYYSGYKADLEGDTLRNFKKDVSRDSQKWIRKELKNTCDKHGIPFDDCTFDETKSCKYKDNQGNFSMCPTEYCQNPENVNKTECKTWCNTNPGKCDETVLTYCSLNKDDTSFCGCINTQKYDDLRNKLTEKGITLIPQCHISECVNAEAYKTETLKTTNCPSQQICLQGVDLTDIQGNASLTNVNYSCNITKDKETTPEITQIPQTSQSSGDKGNKESIEDIYKKSTIIKGFPDIILIVVIIFIFLLLFIKLIF